MIVKMKTQTTLSGLLRMLVTGVVLVALFGLLVKLFGIVGGWRSTLQFSNGMFLMGLAVILLGLLFVWGGFTVRGSFFNIYSETVGELSLVERSRLWMLDSLRGYNVLVVAIICGALLIGLSVIIYTISA
jgi:hypothetical protein